jgi:hypothetical protein
MRKLNRPNSSERAPAPHFTSSPFIHIIQGEKQQNICNFQLLFPVLLCEESDVDAFQICTLRCPDSEWEYMWESQVINQVACNVEGQTTATEVTRFNFRQTEMLQVVEY